MKAMIATQWGEPSEMKYAEVADPTPDPGQVLIDVKAVGCNFPDILIVQGKYQMKPPLPFSPGHEVAGIALAVGAGVTRVRQGQRVFAMIELGAYAERAVADDTHVFAIPDTMSYKEAAAFALVNQTSYSALVHRAQMQPGEWLLVHAAAGGVGLAAVQIGKALGARVIATAGTAAKLEIARQSGADVLVDYRTEDWVERVKRVTDGHGADVIYDPVGGDVFDGSSKCIAFEGRLLVVGFAGGGNPSIAAHRIFLKNMSVVGGPWGMYQTPGSRAGDGLDGFLGDRDHPVELLLGDHEGRRVEDVLHPRPRDHAALAHLLHEPRPDLPVGVELLLGRLVLHQLDGGDETLARANIAHVRVTVEGRVQRLVQARAQGGRALPQPLPLHDLDVLQPHRAAGGMARIRVRVHPLVVGLDGVHGLLDVLGDHDAAQREIARGHALGEGHDVGLHVPVRHGEPVARPAEARDHLVRDEEHLMLVADLAHEGEVVVARVENAAAAVDGLGDEGGHGVGAFADDGLLEKAGGGLSRRLAGLGAILTIRIAGRDVHEVRHARL